MEVYGCARVWHLCGTVVGTQRAPIRILQDFPDIIRNIIRNIRNDMRKEIRIMILLGYGTLYAMRRHKAWRGGSKAQQSFESATALEQKIRRGLSIRINQKSRKKMIKKRSKHRPETY